jgi:succinoglycan biosynthesis transport protein ExoP
MSKNFDLLRLLQEDSRSEGLQSSAPEAFPERRPAPSRQRVERTHDIQSHGWVRMLFILQKHWRLSALFAVLVFGGVAIATLLTKSVYEPAVMLEIDPPGTQAFSLERGPNEASNDAEYLETQAKTLQSDELALTVIRRLGLDHDPDFVDTSKANQNVAKTARANEVAVQLTSDENAALKTFRSRLKVQRDTSSRLLTVTFASHDPVTAAQVANMLVDEFIKNSFRTLHESIMEASLWLSRQLDDIRVKMEQSNRALVEFQKETGIADLDTNKNTLAEQILELDRQFAAARGDRIQFEALLSKTPNGNPESLPQTGDNLVVQQLTEKVAEARAELSRQQVDYGKNHSAVKKLQSEVDQLQVELDLQKRRIFGQLQTSYAAAQSREQSLEHERKLAATQMNHLAQFNTLKKEAQSETELYNSLYARVKEAGIAAGSNSNSVRVIDHARVLPRPSQPRILLNLGFGLLAAVFGGVMIACVREALDNKVRTPEDILNATGIPSVSVLPVIGNGGAARSALGTPSVHKLKTESNGNRCVSKFLLEKPSSAEAEALRSLYTTVMLSPARRPPRALLVVSGSAGEGKTTIAANLAIALARRGPTCLADADLRKGIVSRTFGLHGRKGLSDLLSGSADVRDVVTQVPEVPNLTILPSGTTYQNPGELMADASVGRVVAALRDWFQFVVFDSPPILPYADGRVLSTLVDGLVFVGRYGMTTRAAIAKSIEVLSAIHAAPILEVVLNGADSIVDSEYYSSGY